MDRGVRPGSGVNVCFSLFAVRFGVSFPMFVDRAIITVQAGHGGGGKVSFRREAAEPKGGPDGGDGGKGGSVIVAADDGLSTLYDFRGNPEWDAEDGEPGGSKQCFGGDG